MYVDLYQRQQLGFWGGLVSGSLKLFKTAVPIAAAGATGGASLALTAGSQALQAATGKGSKLQPTAATSAPDGSNFLERMSSTELTLLGLGGLALVAGLARR